MAGTGSLTGPIIVGAVGVELVPVGKDFAKRVRQAVSGDAKKVGEELGKDIAAEVSKPIADQISKGTKDGLNGSTDEAGKAGAKAGAKFGESFKRSTEAAVGDAKRALGKVGVDFEANTGEFKTEIKVVEAELKKLARETVDIPVRADTLKALTQLKALERQTRQANSASGKFARDLQNGLEKALGDLPDVHLDFDLDDANLDEETKKVLKRIAAVRESIADLSSKRLGVDFNGAQAIAELNGINKEIDEIKKNPVRLDFESDLDDVAKDLTGLEKKLGSLNDQKVEIKPKLDEAALGAIRAKILTALEAAQKAVGDIPVGVDATPAQVEIQAIKARIAELHGEVKIGLDEGEALRKIAILNLAFKELTRKKDIDIGTKGNGEAAIKILEGVSNAADDAAKAATNVGGNIVSSLLGTTPAAVAANANVLLLAAGFVALGLTASAIGAGIIGVLVAIGAAIIVALGAFAALAIVLAPIITALTKLATQNSNAAQTAVTNAGKQAALANALDAVTSAEESLSSARTNAATSARNAARAEQQAAQGVTDALSEQTDAQAALTKAKKDTAAAQRDLTLQLLGARLDEKGAQIAVKRAEQQVNIATFSSTATDLDKEEALNNYQQAVLRAKEAKNTTADLADKQKQATKTGVDGAEEVRSAQTRLAKAQREVVDAYQKQKDAATDSKNAQIAAATQIAQAQRALAAAKRNQTQAKLSADTPTADNDPLAKLTQPEKDFVTFLRNTFGPEYKKIKALLEAPILAGLTKLLTSLSLKFPDIEGLATTFANALGDMFDKIDTAVNSDTFRKFLDYLAQNGASILGNITDIVLGLGGAFTELLVALGPSTSELLGSFGDLAKQLGGFAKTDDFKKFVQYVIDNTPTFVDLLGSVLVIIGKLAIGLAPAAQAFLEGAAALAGFLAELSPTELDLVLGLIAGIAAAIAIAIAIVGGPVTAIIATIVGIGLAIVAVSAIVSAFPGFFEGAFNLVKALFVGFVGGQYFVNAEQFVFKYFNKAFFGIYHIVRDAFNYVVKYFNKGLAAIGRAIGRYFTGLYDTAKKRLGEIGKFFSGIGDFLVRSFNDRVKGLGLGSLGDFFTKTIPGYLTTAKDAITGFFKNPLGGGGKKGAGGLSLDALGVNLPDFGALGDKIAAGFDTVRTKVEAVVKKLRSIVEGILAKIGAAFKLFISDPWGTAVAAAKIVVDGVVSAVTNVKAKLVTIFQAIGGFWDTYIVPLWTTAVSVVEKIFDKLRGFAAKPIIWVIDNAINGVLDKINEAAKVLHVSTNFHVDVPPLLKAAAAGHAKGTGFVLPGYAPGVDTEFAVLSKGEAVLVPELTRQIGPSRIMAMNYAARAGRKVTPFANGGVAGVGSQYPNIDAILQLMNLSGIKGVSVNATNPAAYRGPSHADDGGYHSKNEAVDFGGNGKESVRQQIAEFWLGYSRSLLELIHTRPGDLSGWFVKNGQVNDSIYGTRTKLEHRNHVHVAGTAAALLSGIVNSFTTNTATDTEALETAIARFNLVLKGNLGIPGGDTDDIQGVFGKGAHNILDPATHPGSALVNFLKDRAKEFYSGPEISITKIKDPQYVTGTPAQDAAARYNFLHPEVAAQAADAGNALNKYKFLHPAEYAAEKAKLDAVNKYYNLHPLSDPAVKAANAAAAEAAAKASWHKTDPNVDRGFENAFAAQAGLDAKARYYNLHPNEDPDVIKARTAEAAQSAKDALNKYYFLHPVGTLFPKHMVGGKDLANVPRAVSQYAPIAVKALTDLGLSPFYLEPVLRRIYQESGGNPKFAMTGPVAEINRRLGLTGVSAANFGAYSGKVGLNGATDPYANIFAALNYVRVRYGDMTKIDPYTNPALLYDQGGYLPPGLSLVMNKTRDPEPILNTAQWEAMMSDKQQAMRGGLTITHTVHDGQITGLVDSRIDSTFGALADAKIYSGR